MSEVLIGKGLGAETLLTAKSKGQNRSSELSAP